MSKRSIRKRRHRDDFKALVAGGTKPARAAQIVAEKQRAARAVSGDE